MQRNYSDLIYAIKSSMSSSSSLLFVPQDRLMRLCFAACLTKQTKTSRAGTVIREINKSWTGHERMGLEARSGYLERVSQ